MMRLSIHKILAIIAIALVLILLLATLKHKNQSTNPINNTALPTSPTDNASGDTNNEVLHELTAQYQKVVKENQQYQQKITSLSESSNNSNSNINNTTLNVLKQAQDKTQAELVALQNQLTQLQQQTSQPNSASNPDYPVNDSAGQSPTAGMITTVTDMQSMSTSPVTVPITQAANVSTTLETADEKVETTNANHIPYYTIPALSNLANTVLMTSLIGEVPQGSTFAQPPFPFLALVGKHDLLAANGMYLPADLAGMKIAGYSVGVGSFIQGISCTRAYITQVLFVFDDGTSFTVQGKNTSGSNINPDDTLGYLSDPYGNPCIKGKYITNADRVIAMLTGAGFADGVAKGISQAQTNTMTGFDGTTTVFNGSIGKYAAGNGVSVGVEDAANYMQDRLKGTFDVVYVPASHNGIPTHAIANFTKTIAIDLNQHGRKLYYDHYQQNNITAMSGLD